MPPPSATSAEMPSAPAVSERDAGAWFRDEVHAHHGQLKSWLRGTFPAVRDVDDVMQESYLRIWKARSLYRIECAKAFLFQVARRVALDVQRKRRRSPLEARADLAELVVSDASPSAPEILLNRETMELMASVLLDLPERTRQILVLHKLQGLSQREVGERLGLTTKTVEKYVAVALAECAARLGKKGVSGFHVP
jgi:RNA polymerase sigma factor (sigma-70 family)